MRDMATALPTQAELLAMLPSIAMLIAFIGVAVCCVYISYRVGRSRDVVDEPGRDEVIREVMQTGAARAVDMEYVDGSGRLFCLPLRSAREPFGALCLRMAPGTELPEDELGLLQAFSDAATVAIENATLYEDTRRALEVAAAGGFGRR